MVWDVLVLVSLDVDPCPLNGEFLHEVSCCLYEVIVEVAGVRYVVDVEDFSGLFVVTSNCDAA